MGKQSSKKKQHRTETSSVDKGRVVEGIVAELHEIPGFKTESHVFLDPVLAGAKREIDVILTPLNGDLTKRVVFECKNYKEPVGIELVDGFVGKLLDIGTRADHGIFVCVNGYTADAAGRAKRAGIQLLTLHGLTVDRLASAVINATQSIVFLLLSVLSLSVTNKVPKLPNESILGSSEFLMFRDDAGNVCGTLPDLIWNKWLRGEIPAEFGEQTLELTLPPHWLPVVAGKVEPVLKLEANVQVLRLVTELKGLARDHALVSVLDNVLAKRHISVEFETPPEPQPVTVLSTETEWVEFVNNPRSTPINVRLGEIRLPRILITSSYYPPSDRAGRYVVDKMKAFMRGEICDPRPFELSKVEGMGLDTIWEPIMQDHPAVRTGDYLNWINS